MRLHVAGDRERTLGIPVSARCDRENCDLAQAQVDFITQVMQPSFRQVRRPTFSHV
jgi:hypothetical protein